MNKLLVILLALAVAISAEAQKLPTEQLNATMARYYEGCQLLRDGVAKNSQSRLSRAAKLLDESEDNADRIVLGNMALRLDNELVDTVSTEGHMQFNGVYAKSQYEQRNDTFVEQASALRGGGDASECIVYENAIKAHGKLACRTVMSGDCKVFVMAEPGGTVKFTVKGEDGGVICEGAPYEDGTVAYADWMQPANSRKVVLMIENTADKDISFVLASN